MSVIYCSSMMNLRCLKGEGGLTMKVWCIWGVLKVKIVVGRWFNYGSGGKF